MNQFRNPIYGNIFAMCLLGLSLAALLYEPVSGVFSKPVGSWTTEAIVTNIHDGDTVTLSITKTVKVRLQDCWALELSNGGLPAKEELQKIIPVGEKVLLEIPMGSDISKSITLNRFLGRIYKDIDGDGVSDDISEEMVRRGFATKEKGKVIKND